MNLKSKKCPSAMASSQLQHLTSILGKAKVTNTQKKTKLRIMRKETLLTDNTTSHKINQQQQTKNKKKTTSTKNMKTITKRMITKMCQSKKLKKKRYLKIYKNKSMIWMIRLNQIKTIHNLCRKVILILRLFRRVILGQVL